VSLWVNRSPVVLLLRAIFDTVVFVDNLPRQCSVNMTVDTSAEYIRAKLVTTVLRRIPTMLPLLLFMYGSTVPREVMRKFEKTKKLLLTSLTSFRIAWKHNYR
jgi:hypothetical protein